MESLNINLFSFDVLPSEEWSYIPDIRTKYIVSTYGRVGTFVGGRYKLMSESICAQGYRVVYLSESGKRKPYKVHRLVGLTFIPNPNSYPQINHKDENRTNNNVSNLEWCTAKYNLEYSGIISKWRKAGTEKSRLSDKNKIHPFRGTYFRMRLYRYKNKHMNEDVIVTNSLSKESVLMKIQDAISKFNITQTDIFRNAFYNKYAGYLKFKTQDVFFHFEKLPFKNEIQAVSLQ